MRIAFLITRADDIGGAQIHVRDLATALTRLGQDVLVVTGRAGVLSEQLQQRGVAHQPVASLTREIRPTTDLRALWRIRRILKEFEPDLVSTHSTKAGFLGRIAGFSLGIPTLFTAHGWVFADGKPWHLRVLYRVLERLVAPLASRVITVCESDRSLALRSGVASEKDTVTIWNAMPDVDESLRADPSRSPPRLICVARLAPQKDHRTLLHAVHGLLDLDWHLDLIGDGPLRADLEILVSSLGLGSRVSFLGFSRNVPRQLARSQLFVLPTRWEGLPRSIIEAMRAGLPVVATEVGGVGEAVIEGTTGYLVERGEVDQLRERVQKLLARPSERVRLGAAGRSRYEEHFTYDRLFTDCIRLYSDVIADGTPERAGEFVELANRVTDLESPPAPSNLSR